MSTDAGSPIPPRRPFPIDLPLIKDLKNRRVRFEPPQLQHVRSSQTEQLAVEFIAETDGEVPTRSYGPALFVGDVEVNQSERLDRTRWRLLAFDPDRLEIGAPISWGWMKDPQSARHPTPFRYRVEESAR